MLNVASIPPQIGWYLAGFADGEGSFNVSFRPRGDYVLPWKVSLCFNVSQRDSVILALYKQHLGCGTMRQRQDGVWYYEVNNFGAIVENVIPFFQRFHFLSAKKKRDFAKFERLAELFKRGAHLNLTGIREILAIRSDMNDGGKRRYGDEEILARFTAQQENPQRLHARLPPTETPETEMIQSDLHGDVESPAEMPGPAARAASNNDERS